MMGEIVSDEELDMMISVLDINSNRQVCFQVRHSDDFALFSNLSLTIVYIVNYTSKEFKAMVESPDPVNKDFLVK